jgi:hypothetical protein
MKRKPYTRKQGEFELRVLKDGRLVMIAPDETLLEIGQTLKAPGDAGPEASDLEKAEPSGPAGQQTPR